MLEAAIYYLLKKHFRQEKYYVDLMELFHEVSCALASVGGKAPSCPILLSVDYLPNRTRSTHRSHHRSRRFRRSQQILSRKVTPLPSRLVFKSLTNVGRLSLDTTSLSSTRLLTTLSTSPSLSHSTCRESLPLLPSKSLSTF